MKTKRKYLFDSHAGHCSIYSALMNGQPENGICTCGYAFERMAWDYNAADMYSSELLKQRQDVKFLMKQAARLKLENMRLKRGDFTAAEFQNLCHHRDENPGCTLKAFQAGCKAYQKLLFGKTSTKQDNERRKNTPVYNKSRHKLARHRKGR